MASSSSTQRRTHTVLEGRLSYVPLRHRPRDTATEHYFCVDSQLVYWAFFLDFGPLNLGQLYRFCEYLNHKLADPKLAKKHIYYYSSVASEKRANAVFLLSAWSLLYDGKSPEEAWKPFAGIYPPLPPWHDASPTVCTYNLTVLDTLRGIERARAQGFFSFDSFPIEEYEHWEQPSNGDLSWIQYGKILAFAGPHNKRSSHDGYYTLTPEDYIPAYQKWGVKLVIRLNKKYYDEERFIQAGMDHLDLYYLDGSNPPAHILQTVLEAMERCDGAIAIHCKAGLGRTGTCIACHMMKHYGFSAAEAIAWLRVCRPGSVIGPQQQFLEEMHPIMVKEGEAARAAATAAKDELRVAVGTPSLTPGGSSPAYAGGASGEYTPAAAAAATPGAASVASDASQGDHLRASRSRASPATGTRTTPGSRLARELTSSKYK